MRCQFCHNPDTWKMSAGTKYTPEELLKKAVRYRAYWGNEGGITVTGGEPLLQIDFLLELFRQAKEQGIHTTIDTSEMCIRDRVKSACRLVKKEEPRVVLQRTNNPHLFSIAKRKFLYFSGNIKLQAFAKLLCIFRAVCFSKACRQL